MRVRSDFIPLWDEWYAEVGPWLEAYMMIMDPEEPKFQLKDPRTGHVIYATSKLVKLWSEKEASARALLARHNWTEAEFEEELERQSVS